MSRPRALVVVPQSTEELPAVAQHLLDRGFAVAITSDFLAAKQQVMEVPPLLLVTAVRLADYNGLYLLHLARATGKGDMAAVVIGEEADSPLRGDVEHLAGVFVTTPASPDAMYAAVERALTCSSAAQRLPGAVVLRRAQRREPERATAPDAERRRRRGRRRTDR